MEGGRGLVQGAGRRGPGRRCRRLRGAKRVTGAGGGADPSQQRRLRARCGEESGQIAAAAAGAMFSFKPPKATFRSYLPPQPEEKITPEPRLKKLEPVLLPGEIVVNEVNFVRKCIATDTNQDDLWGKLICSNFKISFVTDDPMPLQKFHYKNLLLGEHDVALTCIEQIVTVNDTKRKQKVLGPNQKLKFNPTELIIYCKDFRIVRFRFDEAGPESAKKVCLAIAHYSQPADLQLLFAFEYVGKKYHNPAKKVNGIDPGGGGGGSSGSSSQQTPLFETYSDWDREMKRTGASEWRVCSVNEGYMISTCLPEYFVVPSSLADQDLKLFSPHFTGRRMPMWCWNHSNGSALVRMASIKEPLQQRKIDQRICNAITRSHPQRSDVYKSDLDKSLPNIQDIQAAFLKLKQLCVNEPFEETEEKWLSSLENSHWLEYVRLLLKHSAELVYMLDSKHVSVVLQEEEGRDLSCCVASLVQVMLDPFFRTITGFQSLIQKEWVMAGYPFLDRCNHLKKSDKESPLFLLFLDCAWQLLQQYPSAFEFSEAYLTILYDSTRISLFGTFLFNSPHQRVKQSTEFAISRNIQLGDEKGLKFPSVWDWSLQHTARDRMLFHSPLYIGKSAPCVHRGGMVKSFKRSKKNYSSTLRGLPPSLKNGIISEPDFLPRRNSLILKLKPDFLQHTDHHANGNLCRRSILGTPLSKFLSGAKIWLSTETLANED
ncbi:myotubularin-related protein 10 isoform X2 [Hemicordylus capensis]|uniref:myotubularin-related protein 10 isoform X2 n=1 Tax=Hemicordylus capensis TaxID=884348 RepID=UPI002303161F|nr:myotubularin-related protein 10 isoform X2 [Hemicordylus capensis]